jgi:hypothetical protein
MRRRQLVEFEDLSWFPPLIRAYLQDHLAFMGNLSAPAYRAFVVKLKDAMASAGQTELLDLCSGSGGPVQTILRLLREQGVEVRAHLSDLFPNIEAYRRITKETAGVVSGVESSVDATNVPEELTGFRLIANGFHHFPPDAATKVLGDAVTKQQGIAIVEMVNRSALAFTGVGVGFVLALLSAPFLKPFRFSRLFFTYVVPLVPFFLLWDGIVSCLRVYSPEELRVLISQLSPHGYQWEVGELRFGPGVATYMIGVPRAT